MLRKNKLRPGTKVFGTPSAGFSLSITIPGSVNELCPNRPMKETSITSNSTSALRAISRASSTSFRCFCPYRKLNAYTFLNSRFAQNRQVVESCPPLNTTNAASLFMIAIIYKNSSRKLRQNTLDDFFSGTTPSTLDVRFQ